MPKIPAACAVKSLAVWHGFETGLKITGDQPANKLDQQFLCVRSALPEARCLALVYRSSPDADPV
jgi:hypothetical protein